MIQVLPSPQNVAAFRISGTVTPEDYNDIIPTLEERLRASEHIGVFADLTDLGDLTTEAIRRDISYGMSKFGQFHRFKRTAVITDKPWIASATKLTGALLPEVEARVFEAGDSEAAMAWVAASNDGSRKDRAWMWAVALAVTAVVAVFFLAARKRR